MSTVPATDNVHNRTQIQCDVVTPVERVATSHYEGQKPGTSGLRKKVKVYQQKNYLENFVQSCFNAIGKENVVGKTFAVGGDGRYFSKHAIEVIVNIAAGNGVGKMIIGTNGLVCTPAMSCLIRDHPDKISGGFILTASHNPGGENEDFGVKYNCENGEPALEALTGEIYSQTMAIKEYYIAEVVKCDIKGSAVQFDLGKPGVLSYNTGMGPFVTEVIDSVAPYINLLETIFDFPMIKKLTERDDFSIVFDGMNGVAGPYAIELFRRLGCNDTTAKLVRCEPMVDFGGIHPDPNLVYNKFLVDIMYGRNASFPTVPVLGAAADGDADRNMIMGGNFFVSPSDSLAIIVHYAERCIPWMKNKLKGVARSMPTSTAIDRVAKKLGLKNYETPTGWKYFGNLMDAGEIQICGEESFGTGGSHVREKDGLWAVLAWLSIVAYENQDVSKKLKTVKDITEGFWREYGRCFYQRFDYEGVSSEGANKLMEFVEAEGLKSIGTLIKECTNFTYEDPIDKSISKNQGLIYVFEDGSRVVWRLSGTGSEGATVRMYIEKIWAAEEGGEAALKALSEQAVKMCKIKEFCGRDEPTVIT